MDEQPRQMVPKINVEPSAEYEIIIKGVLVADYWAQWFDGLSVIVDVSNGSTVLHGEFVDQAALYGLLSRVRDLGLPLLAVRQIKENTSPGGIGGGKPGVSRGLFNINWLLVVCYLFFIGGMAALTVFLSSDLSIHAALSLFILFAVLGGLAELFFRIDGGWAWRMAVVICGLGAAVNLVVFDAEVGLFPVSLSLAILGILAGMGLLYIVYLRQNGRLGTVFRQFFHVRRPVRSPENRTEESTDLVRQFLDDEKNRDDRKFHR